MSQHKSGEDTLKNRNELLRKIDDCMIADQHRLKRKLKEVFKNGQESRFHENLNNLVVQIEQSSIKVAARLENVKIPTVDADLPVVERKEEIARLINENQVVILCGETGSGKTTQLPQICLEIGRGIKGKIAHTQPRRIAARSVATRIAEEMGEELGQSIGFKVRFSEKASADGYIKLMTDGILLAETQQDRYLNQYDTIIIDEAHERSLNIDFLLGYIKNILPKRPDLKVIITSATIDPQRFSEHFNSAPVIEVSGRTYPVEVRYRPLVRDDEFENDRDQLQAILEAVEEAGRIDRGDILIFLAGERDIKETSEFLFRAKLRNSEIYPLYSRLSPQEQMRIFKPCGKRKIVLATNVAETSLTVPGIKFVIDPGNARISRYSHRTKVQRLPVERISQASANQRKGRCGRVSAGICFRLYDEDDFLSRPEFTDPEILRTNLASVILQMEAMRLGIIDQFPFIEKPDSRLINDGYKLLEEIGAIDQNRKLTKSGRILSRIPIDPRIGRILLAAAENGVLAEVLIIASVLEVQDPRLRPMEQQGKADEAHKQFADERSDFLTYLKLWWIIQKQKAALSNNGFRKWCAENFLSYLRVREWFDIHRQLATQLTENGYKANAEIKYEKILEENDRNLYEQIHTSILCGFISNIATIFDKGEYLAARNIKVRIFPGSAVSAKQPKWIMAAEFIETSRLFASTVARIEPQWIEAIAAHLLKHNYFEPRWEKRAGRVIGSDRVILYGLTVNPKKRVGWQKVSVADSREIMLRSALVEQNMNTRLKFYQENSKTIADIQNLESKSRRRDILIEDETIFEFYDNLIPQYIANQKSLEKWYKDLSDNEQEQLLLTEEFLMQHQAEDVTEVQFPEELICGDIKLPLRYVFEPGNVDDGVNVKIPLPLLSQIENHHLDWLVPGLLHDKITEMIKGLPKKLRRNFVPAPDYARACIESVRERHPDYREYDMRELLTKELKRISAVNIPMEEWQMDSLPEFLRMKISIVNENNQKVGQGRSLIKLKQEFSGKMQNVLDESESTIERNNITTWDCEEFPKSVEVSKDGVTFKAYPAYTKKPDGSVSVVLYQTHEQAERAATDGICQLIQMELKDRVKYIKRNIPQLDSMALLYSPIGSKQELVDDFVNALFLETFINGKKPPSTRKEFLALLNDNKQELVTKCNEIASVLKSILEEYHALAKILKQKGGSLAFIKIFKEIQEQVLQIIYAGFITDTPYMWFRRIPQYFKAAVIRTEKLQIDPKRDANWTVIVEPYIQKHQQFKEKKNMGVQIINEIEVLKWMVEEFKVSVYAQGIKTAMPISEKRLEKQIGNIEKMIAQKRSS